MPQPTTQHKIIRVDIRGFGTTKDELRRFPPVQSRPWQVSRTGRGQWLGVPQHDQRPLCSSHGRELRIEPRIPIRVSPDPNHTIRGKSYRPIFDLSYVMSSLLEDRNHHTRGSPEFRSKAPITECDCRLLADRLFQRNHMDNSQSTTAWPRDGNWPVTWVFIEITLL